MIARAVTNLETSGSPLQGSVGSRVLAVTAVPDAPSSWRVPGSWLDFPVRCDLGARHREGSVSATVTSSANCQRTALYTGPAEPTGVPRRM
jgi:hypothetical protein